jgi:ribosomal RNA-processing protein 9
MKSFEAIADVIPISGVINSLQLVQVPTSAVANARWYQAKASGEKANGVPANINGKSSNGSVGSGKKVILVVAAVGRETRTGRWLRLGESEIVKNCGLVVPLEIGS